MKRTVRGVAVAIAMLALGMVAEGRTQVLSFGLGAGLADPQNVDAALFLSFDARLAVGPFIAVNGEVGYWQKDIAGPGGEATTMKDLQLGGNLLFMFPLLRLHVFIGGGVSAHQLDSDIEIPFIDEADPNTTKLGVQLLGGVDLLLSSKLALFATARRDIVFAADINQVKIYGGIRLGL